MERRGHKPATGMTEAVTQLLLTLFGDEAAIVCDERGRPTALQITIQLHSDPSKLHEALKSFNADTDRDGIDGDGGVVGCDDCGKTGT